jgi:cytidine deaminase
MKKKWKRSIMMLTDEMRNSLIQTANNARKWAYAPYSHYAVGAALLTESGRIYDGVNVENAAYPAGICAERVAVFKAVSEGERSFAAIAVVTSNGGSPCGSCRQVLAEFGLETVVVLADEHGKVVQETRVADLLPGAFLPRDLMSPPLDHKD